MKGRDFMNQEISYYVVYDNVDGLTKSNPVIINGLTVGKVKKIKLSQDLASSIQPGYRVFLDYINTDIGSFLVDTVDTSGNVYFKNY